MPYAGGTVGPLKVKKCAITFHRQKGHPIADMEILNFLQLEKASYHRKNQNNAFS
jgi:hypothetical protein